MAPREKLQTKGLRSMLYKKNPLFLFLHVSIYNVFSCRTIFRNWIFLTNRIRYWTKERKQIEREMIYMYELVEHDPPYSTLYICLISKLLSRIKRVVQIVHLYLFLTLLDIFDIGSMDQDDDVCKLLWKYLISDFFTSSLLGHDKG